MNIVTTLQTQRLILRKFRDSDLEDLYEYAKDPDVGPNAGWEPHSNRYITRKILNNFIQKDEVWAIVWKETGKVIGSIGLHKDSKRDINNAKKLGYVLSKEYWGRGLMPEAVKRIIAYVFEELDLPILCVEHFPFNSKSKRVIEKCGFQYEGILRRSYTNYEGKLLDQICYSMIPEEYQEKKEQGFFQ